MSKPFKARLSSLNYLELIEVDGRHFVFEVTLRRRRRTDDESHNDVYDVDPNRADPTQKRAPKKLPQKFGFSRKENLKFSSTKCQLNTGKLVPVVFEDASMGRNMLFKNANNLGQLIRGG